MNPSFLKAILILPGTALVYVPALLIWLSKGTRYEVSLSPLISIQFMAGALSGSIGLALMVWTMRLFVRLGGGGTPAPWDPVQNLIVEGPYRYVRNPMLTGVILFQAAEALLLQSFPILLWMTFFFILNTLYFAFREEPELERRYGDAYRDYEKAVPRWLPRLSPYTRVKRDS